MLKQFFKYITQSVAGMIGISVYILADTFFISVQSGADGLAVLNLIPACLRAGLCNRRHDRHRLCYQICHQQSPGRKSGFLFHTVYFLVPDLQHSFYSHRNFSSGKISWAPWCRSETDPSWKRISQNYADHYAAVYVQLHLHSLCPE